MTADVDFFETLWRSAVRYRRVTRHLQPLVRAVHRDLVERSPALKSDLEALLAFLASERGRTDANCCAVDFFFSQCQSSWAQLPPPLRDIFEGMSGTLHDAIYAPKIAANFGSLPEQLLERLRDETASGG
jgi:hypothetical protein